MIHYHEDYDHVSAEVVADSVWEGARITTLHVWYPRFILAQLNTHGLLARSTRSSRAVPSKVLLEEVRDFPVLPYRWLKNRRGMQGGEEIDGDRPEAHWMEGARSAVETAKKLADAGVAKEVANRPLEPYLHAHTLVTATEWANFFALRLHHDAQPEFQALAATIKAAIDASEPVERAWHLPYTDAKPDDGDEANVNHMYVSAARCARISYRAFDGDTDVFSDLRRSNKLWADGHRSPFDHPATAERGVHGRFRGWMSARMWLGDVGIREVTP